MDSTLILLALVFAVFIAFQFYSGKRRKKQAEERATAIVPGAEVMTREGMFGTVVSIDDDANAIYVELAPKVVVKFHSQAIRGAMVVPIEIEEEEVDDEPEGPQLNSSSATPMEESEPEFGERTKKPTRKKPSSDDK